jgi:hypothetical protein
MHHSLSVVFELADARRRALFNLRSQSFCVLAAMVIASSAVVAQAEDEVPPGTPSVEALLPRLLADRAIELLRDPKTGDVLEDPKLGIPRFQVPDTETQ